MINPYILPPFYSICVGAKAHGYQDEYAFRSPVDDREHHNTRVKLFPRLKVKGDVATPQTEERLHRPPGAQCRGYGYGDDGGVHGVAGVVKEHP